MSNNSNDVAPAREIDDAAGPEPVVLLEISSENPKFAQLVEARHRRYRRSTTGGIQDEILELWQDLRNLKLTIAEVVPAARVVGLNDGEPVSSLPTDDGGVELRRWDNARQCWDVWPLTRSQAASLIGDLARSLAIR